MAEKQITSIAAAFQSLPENIRDWATSDSTTFSISEINKKLGLKEEKKRIIPSLILRMITQELEPIDFINELSYQLGTSFQTAKSISQDIENSVLKPIENELRKNAGVDIKLIYFGQPQSKSTPLNPPNATPVMSVPPPTEQAYPSEPKITELIKPLIQPTAIQIEKSATPLLPLPQGIKKTEENISKPKEPSVDLQSFEFKTEEPFILHQEGKYSTILSESNFSKAKPALNIKVKDYYQSEREIKKPAPKPTAIKLETPQPDTKQQRVVNYSGPTTKLNNLGLPKIPDENTVDLRKFIKPNK